MALFTRENASEMGKRSGEARRSEPLKSVPPGYKIVPADVADVKEHVPATDEYADLVLARTRTQLDLIAVALSAELAKPLPDSRRLRDLTDAQGRLAEQERVCAGRPLPGSRRPAPDKPSRRTVQSGPAYQVPDEEPALPSTVPVPPSTEPDDCSH